MNSSVVPEALVLLSQEVPSEEVKMDPLSPFVTQVLFPYVTPHRFFVVSVEVFVVQPVPSDEVRIVPCSPTAINNGTAESFISATSSVGEAVAVRAGAGVTERLRGITYGNSIFVAVGRSGTILTSSDGTTWTSRTSGTTEHFRRVAYKE